MLKKRKEKKKNKNKVTKIIKKYRYKIDIKYQKAKIKNLEQSLEFQKYNVKKKGRRDIKRENKQTNKNKQCCKNFKENTGTKLISNTKKHKLKIQSKVWNFRYTMLYFVYLCL